MTGITAHGIRHPDGASRARDLGPELKTMADDLDALIWDGVGPIAEDLVHGIVVDELASTPTVEQAAVDAMQDAAVQAQLAYHKANIAAGQDFDSMTASGAYSLSATPTDWQAQHMPANARGTLVVLPVIGTTSTLQLYFVWGALGAVAYSRSSVSGSWLGWSQIGAGSEAMVAAADFDTYRTPGTYSIAAVPTDWQAQHMPANVRGVLQVLGMNTTSAFLQLYVTWEAKPRLFLRWYASGAFGSWTEPGATAPPPAASPASGMKLVGVPITAGHAGTDAPLEATQRLPLLFGAPITRWRLRLHDVNPRSGATRGGAVTVSGIWLGRHTGAGAMSDPVQLTGAFTIADAATEYRTPWFNTPLEAGIEYLLSMGYSKASAPWAMLSHAYQTADDANAGATAPAGMVKVGTAAFTISIEAETYAHTPVVASLGDSNSVGVGATRGLFDSWLSQLCRRIGALPVHLGSSGDTLANSLTAGYKYTRFAGLARADAVLFALGQNDAAASGATSASIVPNIATVLGHLQQHIASSLYAVNYMPRTADPWAGFEALRRELNAHLSTQPAPLRDVFDIAAAISSDDETIRPEFDADGTHLNAAGFAAVQAAISRPVTAPPVQYATA